MGLDLSLTATGIAVVGEDQEGEAWELKPGPRRGVERLIWLRDGIRAAISRTTPSLVAIEGYSFGSTSSSSSYQLGELGGVIRCLLWELGLAFVEVPPGEWRKALFGRGNLPKDQVRVEALKRYGVEFDSLDALEAWCVATAVLRRHQGLTSPAPIRKTGHGEIN